MLSRIAELAAGLAGGAVWGMFLIGLGLGLLG
jgi:hypothetical protein